MISQSEKVTEWSNTMPIYFLVDNNGGGQVKVDVGIVSCSCSDFNQNRAAYKYGDPRRMCKHLVEALAIEQMIGMPVNLRGFTEEPVSRKGTGSLQARVSIR
jgi:hypothetical protein